MTTYRDDVKQIRAMKAELNQNFSIMTVYERGRVEGAIESQVNMTRHGIISGMLADWNAALTAHKAASRAVDEARRREAGRWQPDRLGMEINLARMAFDRASSVQEAQAEYQRALESNDPAKMRAYSEVFSGALNKFRDDRLPAHRLSVDASRKAAELQSTPEITAALERGADATKRVIDLQQELGGIAREIGMTSAIFPELNKVAVSQAYDQDHGAWSYSIEIREPEKVTA
jgi:hypothetical protein